MFQHEFCKYYYTQDRVDREQKKQRGKNLKKERLEKRKQEKGWRNGWKNSVPKTEWEERNSV